MTRQPHTQPARERMLAVLADYWPQATALVAALPIPSVPRSAVEPLPPQLVDIAVPPWGAAAAVDGHLLVPLAAVVDGTGDAYTRVDWWYAAAWYLDAHAERAYESLHGPIHSYAVRLRGWNSRQWDYAWVNRMALFLRLWVAHLEGRDVDAVCGPAPIAQIHMTHDVDAIAKTLPIRLKQAVFKSVNCLRALARGDGQGAWRNLRSALRFLLAPADYWQFPVLLGIERDAGIRSRVNLFAGRPAKPWQLGRWLLDPTYDVGSERLRHQLRTMASQGWTIGLHPSFFTWDSVPAFTQEKQRLEAAVGKPITTLRQHWLRFSWARTWAAQRAAGFVEDTTLGFNERPGFRAGAAWAFTPLDGQGHSIAGMTAWPMVLMDSHLHDYGDMDTRAIEVAIERWLDEIWFVGGRATIVWHQRVMHPDYGWKDSFRHAVAYSGALSRRSAVA